MKKLFLGLSGLVLLGAGCMTPVDYIQPPVSSRPRPSVPPSVRPAPPAQPPAATTTVETKPPVVIPPLVVTDAIKKQFAKDYLAQVARHKQPDAVKLAAGSYFFSHVQTKDDAGVATDLVLLLKRTAPGEYTIVSQDLATSVFAQDAKTSLFGDLDSLNTTTLILEPSSGQELYFLEKSYKDLLHAYTFDLVANKAKDAVLAGSLHYVISPTQDRLVRVGDNLTDYGRFLLVDDLHAGISKPVAPLPKGETYARSTYAPNQMAEGLASTGVLSWTDGQTVKAAVYSDASIPMDSAASSRKSLRTISVNVVQ